MYASLPLPLLVVRRDDGPGFDGFLGAEIPMPTPARRPPPLREVLDALAVEGASDGLRRIADRVAAFGPVSP